ncbi:hypothetical protein L596_021450 [Steinernema carpocapsae]|uniref:Phlebovirus glycoprotein G2 fusion domain-containing protein n=1 Tax=Steinernema carpocapsae TaxID=34508 RepID=A0A4U5MIR8_STECR|nr:hypothetical protein L596_021450 [Steinernema carpocapsae]
MCSNTTCATLSVTDHLSEVSNEANSWPGFNYCSESCGCFACGCFFCSPGCLFYRIFAKPTTPMVYSVVTCPSWSLSVPATITLRLQDHSPNATSLTLHPGHPITSSEAVSVTLASESLPPLPFLSSTFVIETSGSRATIIGSSEQGHLIPGTVGQLQCSSLAAATNFNCSFSPTACHCRPATNTMNCDCSEGSLEELFEADHRRLPLTYGGHFIEFSDNIITVDIKRSSTKLHIELLNVTTAASHHHLDALFLPPP